MGALPVTSFPNKQRAFAEWNAWLRLGGWAGCTRQAVVVIGETPDLYRIACDDKPVRLAGRRRMLDIGSSTLVPKYAVSPRDEEENEG